MFKGKFRFLLTAAMGLCVSGAAFGQERENYKVYRCPVDRPYCTAETRPVLTQAEAARADATALGFAPTDPMELIDTGAGSARVRAEHAGARYQIRVIQPARLGPTGIWVVSAIRSI